MGHRHPKMDVICTFFSEENNYSAHFTKGNSFRVTLYNGAERKLLNIEHLREVHSERYKKESIFFMQGRKFLLEA